MQIQNVIHRIEQGNGFRYLKHCLIGQPERTNSFVFDAECSLNAQFGTGYGLLRRNFVSGPSPSSCV